MQVFKSYFKILRRGYIWTFILYLGVFTLITIIFNGNSSFSANTEFSAYKCQTVIIDNDDTDFSNSFKEYMKKNTTPVELKNEEDIKDSLFFREIEAAIVIPKGFTDEFMQGKDPVLDIQSVPDSADSKLVTLTANSYLNTYRLYSEGNKSLTNEEISRFVNDDLGIHSKINTTVVKNDNVQPKVETFYNFISYALLAIATLSIGSINAKMNDIKINRRNSCSPKKQSSSTLEIMLANGIVVFVMLVVFNLCAFILYFHQMTAMAMLYYFVNSFVFSLICLGIGILLGYTCKLHMIMVISNVISLGFSFLCGAFVPQSLLSKSVIDVAHFLPAYWFIRNNNVICNAVGQTGGIGNEYYFNLLVQFGFAIAVVSVIFVLFKYRKTAEA